MMRTVTSDMVAEALRSATENPHLTRLLTRVLADVPGETWTVHDLMTTAALMLETPGITGTVVEAGGANLDMGRAWYRVEKGLG